MAATNKSTDNTTSMPRCKRCKALGIKPPGIARVKGLCRWCRSMGEQDNKLREAKGWKTYPVD